jgi:hypothetical protein
MRADCRVIAIANPRPRAGENAFRRFVLDGEIGVG